METNPKSQSSITEPAAAKSLLGEIQSDVHALVGKLQRVALVEDIKDGVAHLEKLDGWLKEKLGLIAPKKTKKPTTSK